MLNAELRFGSKLDFFFENEVRESPDFFQITQNIF